jgi:predicted RNase H-like nuclease
LYLTADLSRQQWIYEVHPEVSFAAWNGGRPMAYRKSSTAGRAERSALIGATWQGQPERLWRAVCGEECEPDDLNDAFAALWTVRRMAAGKALRIPEEVESDESGLRMEILV